MCGLHMPCVIQAAAAASVQATIECAIAVIKYRHLHSPLHHQLPSSSAHGTRHMIMISSDQASVLQRMLRTGCQAEYAAIYVPARTQLFELCPSH